MSPQKAWHTVRMMVLLRSCIAEDMPELLHRKDEWAAAVHMPMMHKYCVIFLMH